MRATVRTHARGRQDRWRSCIRPTERPTRRPVRAMATKYVTKGGVGENPMTNVLNYLFARPGPSGYGSGTTAQQVVDGEGWDGQGKVAIVTGSNTGLGKECAAALASKGAEVVVACRDAAKGREAAASIQARHPGAKVTVQQLDLASLASVRAFAAEFKATKKPLHVLVCNAGIMACPFALSADGHESQFATNHLGHFLLVDLLKPVLAATGAAALGAGANDARVVVLASAAHFTPYSSRLGGPVRLLDVDSPERYDAWGAYGQSKLCNVLFARELHRRLKAEGVTGVTAAACHPGVIDTELFKHVKTNPVAVGAMSLLSSVAFKSVPQGAATQTYLAVGKDVLGGEYYADCGLSPSTSASHDAELGRKLWELSERLVALA